LVRKRNGKSEKTEKRKVKTADKISYFGQRRHIRNIDRKENYMASIIDNRSKTMLDSLKKFSKAS